MYQTDLRSIIICNLNFISNLFVIYTSADNEKSSAQKKYEQSRFRVQPGRIEEYSLGRGSIARQEVEKVRLT